MDHFIFKDRKYSVDVETSAEGLESWISIKAYDDDARDFLYLTFLYNISTREFTIDFEVTIKEMLYTNDAILNDWVYNVTFHNMQKQTIWQLAISKVPGLFAVNQTMYEIDTIFLEKIKSEIAEDPETFHQHVKKAIIDSMI